MLYCFLCVSQLARKRRAGGGWEPQKANQRFLSSYLHLYALCPAVSCPRHAACSAVSRVQGISAGGPNAAPVHGCPLHKPSCSQQGSLQRPSLPNRLLALPGGPGRHGSLRCRVLHWHRRQSRSRGSAAAEAAAGGRERHGKANSQKFFLAGAALRCGTPAPLGSGLDVPLGLFCR